MLPAQSLSRCKPLRIAWDAHSWSELAFWSELPNSLLRPTCWCSFMEKQSPDLSGLKESEQNCLESFKFEEPRAEHTHPHVDP